MDAPTETAGSTSTSLWWAWLGLIPYLPAWELQRRLATRRLEGELPDLLLLLEHPPTYTIGRRSDERELPASRDHYERLGIEVHETDRGGRVTYHGPGQLVGYAIFAVTDVVAYVRALEQALVRALGRYGIAARARPNDGPDYTGVWVGKRKIASIGVHVSRGVTTHGFALNLCCDLAPFSWIVPCGLAGVEMTSVERELGRPLDGEPALEFGRACAQELASGRQLHEVSAAELGGAVVGAGR